MQLPKKEATVESTEALKSFYEEVGNALLAKGLTPLATGGIACVAYKLAQKTKDCDIIIPVDQAHRVLEHIATTTFHGAPPHYALNYGAPLDSRWLAGGWSSHTFFGDAENTEARLDIFGLPPRVKNPRPDEKRFYLSRDGVAAMKKTQRDKDWPFVSILGMKMLVQDNPRGFLHLFDEQELLKEMKIRTPSAELIAERPVLELARIKSPNLLKYLKAERDFWQTLDRLRLDTYKAAWVPYRKAVEALPELRHAPLLTQHAQLVALAQTLLPKAPLAGKHAQLIQQAKAVVVATYNAVDANLLPNPILIADEDDAGDAATTARPAKPVSPADL